MKNFKIGHCSELVKGKGLRFKLVDLNCSKRADSKEVQTAAVKTGFVIEFGQQLFAFENSCPHLGFELDWSEGDFFDDEGEFLMCSTHGAMFDPKTGKCLSGPCLGRSLKPLDIILEQGEIVYCPSSSESS